jgi:hypothetical protein
MDASEYKTTLRTTQDAATRRVAVVSVAKRGADADYRPRELHHFQLVELPHAC